LIAIISDIHANFTALEAVLNEILCMGVDRIICLGDIVGYGPDPVPCVDAVRERCEVCLCGNHDFGLIYGAQDFNPVARAALEFHRGLLMPLPDLLMDNDTRQAKWDFLKNLPYRYVEGECLFVHAAPRNPVIEYLRRLDVQLGMSDKLTENFNEVDWLCFNGHTHRAGIITGDMKWIEPSRIGGVFKPSFQQKAIINVGSVGQPRDRDLRACFVTINEDTEVRYHRVEYDVESVAERIDGTPGLDHSLAQRLLDGR
jgi:diadenosine tetraphosphatase ApaH/serine/threonine PP2A family protein phosphatase